MTSTVAAGLRAVTKLAGDDSEPKYVARTVPNVLAIASWASARGR